MDHFGMAVTPRYDGNQVHTFRMQNVAERASVWLRPLWIDHFYLFCFFGFLYKFRTGLGPMKYDALTSIQKRDSSRLDQRNYQAGG